MKNDVILNKVSIIERCIKRVREEYKDNPDNLNNFTKQDSIILNIQRSCEACIDIAMHIIATEGLGLPQSSRDAFDILHSQKIINDELSRQMKAMVGFRNIAVHDYRTIQLNILQKVIEVHLDDFTRFTKTILSFYK
ncbi:hypothetical protein CU633_08005 [Bacillus sp. V3-13]|uniref:type VII toxin-antitoxin system HepT family RNase toxin n=1 Tax=Bacillus sp. V3-13 TaxID=2053728 RepID=UPI000C7614A4|nr:DUF86 domain-containing protein [Bacillus sp. V3-13]PLR77958.1 hypothetical protein CU633_08005 [Bacillus sp. V3-13]